MLDIIICLNQLALLALQGSTLSQCRQGFLRPNETLRTMLEGHWAGGLCLRKHRFQPHPGDGLSLQPHPVYSAKTQQNWWEEVVGLHSVLEEYCCHGSCWDPLSPSLKNCAFYAHNTLQTAKYKYTWYLSVGIKAACFNSRCIRVLPCVSHACEL